MSVLNVLKLRRMIAGIKQQELADAVGMAESTLSKIETGRRKPTDDETRKLAKQLGCKPERLFDLDDVTLPSACQAGGLALDSFPHDFPDIFFDRI